METLWKITLSLKSLKKKNKRSWKPKRKKRRKLKLKESRKRKKNLLLRKNSLTLSFKKKLKHSLNSNKNNSDSNSLFKNKDLSSQHYRTFKACLRGQRYSSKTNLEFVWKSYKAPQRSGRDQGTYLSN